MAETLPYNVWMTILRHVSFADRIKNVQYVCKQLQALCLDESLMRNMDFSKAVLMPNDTCLKLICGAKEVVSSLCLKNCHWLVEDFFMNLPQLKHLESLDLSGCFRSASCLYYIVKNAPSLKELAFTITGEDLRLFFRRCEETEKGRVNLCLERLHIECHPGVYVHTDFTSDIARFFLPLGRRPKSFSMIWATRSESIVKLFSIPSEHTMDYECSVHLVNLTMHRALCTALSCAGFHQLSDWSNGMPSALPRYDLTKIRFLSLPKVFPLSFSGRLCSDMRCPTLLPNLECLSLPLGSDDDEGMPLLCYDKLIKRLLFSCVYPNLRCLRLTGYRLGVPFSLYSRIAELKWLEELHLTHLLICLRSLLESLKGLKLLHTLSVFPAAELEKNCARATSAHVYHDLLEILPNLKKLEITWPEAIGYAGHHGCLKILEKLHLFSKFEKLSLRNVQYPAQFHDVLSKCVNVTSVNFSYKENESSRNYELLISYGLSKMPYLTELFLTDQHLEYSQTLFESVSQCKKLEKIVISGLIMAHLDDDVSSASTMCQFLQPVLDSCPRLYAFFLVVDAAELWCKKLDAAKRDLRYNPRVILKFLPIESNQSFFKWIQFDTSFVYDHNAYNFPYSNIE